MADGKPGGWSPTEKATEEIQKICNEVRSVVEAKTMKNYQEFVAVQYRKQIVAGTNYAIKVHVGGPKYLQLNIFESLPCNGGEIQLIKVEENHSKDDPIVPF